MMELLWPGLQRGHWSIPWDPGKDSVCQAQLRLQIIMAWFRENLAQREFLWCRH